MPIYEYQCTQCEHCFEMIHGVSDKDLKITCPRCGAANPRRMMSAFSCAGSQDRESGAGASCAPRPGGRFS
jgi:putative FmdB family regulatory protein